jgi:hypothetical protein
MKVSELKTEMDGKFTAVDQELKGLREQVTSATTTLSQRFDEMDNRIRSEGEATRRHFDVVAEKIVGERNLALDRSLATAEQLAGLTAANAGDHVRVERRLDDHERRLEAVEQDRDVNQL